MYQNVALIPRRVAIWLAYVFNTNSTLQTTCLRNGQSILRFTKCLTIVPRSCILSPCAVLTQAIVDS